MNEAFLQQGSLAHWLLYSDHIVNQVVNTIVGALIAIVIVGGIVRPTLRRWGQVLSREWAEHKRLLGAREQLCPVCTGKGAVPVGFYPGTALKQVSGVVTEQCRRCGGLGTIQTT